MSTSGDVKLSSVSLGKQEEQDAPEVTPSFADGEESEASSEEGDLRSLLSVRSFGFPSTVNSRLDNSEDCDVCGKPSALMPVGTGHQTSPGKHNRCPDDPRLAQES